ncbi:MAG: hypothetical protein ABIL05_04000, partial [candidate division WOR-3 bacterium]
VAFADLKLLNFRTYDSLRTSGIAFDDDYAYIGGTGGIERYDKYRDQWFLIETRGAVNDLFLLNDQLFVAGDSGLEIYNTRYEKFEELSYQISERLVHIINTQHNIFFIGDNYFFKYNKETHTWQRLEQFSFNDYAVQGDSVWMATDDGIMVYDEIIGRWDRYRKTEWYPDKEITALSVTSKMLVLGSNYGVNVIDNQTQSCTRYNLTSGLIDEKILKIYEENGQVFLLTPEWIQYLDDKGNWKRQKIEGEFIPRGRLFTIDEAGGHLTFSPDFRVSLQGRATIEYEREDTIAQTTEIIDGRMLIGKPGDRQMVVYYDDTEKERKLYGATYQDPGGFLSRARVGKIRTELYKSSLMPLVSYLGGGGRLETKFAALDLSAGKLGSAFAVEYFTGNSDQHLVLIRDINYIRNVFFIIDTINPGLKPRSESVYVDNRNPLDNTKNTLTGFSIAGVSGDFDYQYRGIDYTVDEERGIIQFLKAISDSAVVAIRYNGGQERILQGRGQDSLELKNYYMLGATNIMPRTLIVRIFRDNIEQPLYLFGLDENRDGFVDEQFINYLNGHLHFPARQPFPDSVYYPNPVSYYNIMVSYRARTGSYILAHTPIVVNSEEVILDGVPLRRGIDYIIDYSTGNLVFLEKGQVLPKSEIEVRYEYEIETDSLTSCAQLVVSPDQKLEIIPGFYQAGQRAVGNLTSEWQMNLKSCNLKVRPEAGVNIEDRSAYGGKISLYSSFNRLRVNSFYENYLPGFESFGRRVCNYGELSNRYYLYSKYEFTNYLSMDGSFDRREAQDTSLDARYYRRIATGGLYFTHPALPVVSISGAERNYSGDAPQPHQKRYSVYSSIDYPVPDKYLKPISVKNLKIGTSYYIEQIKERGQMDLEARNRQLTFSSTLPLSNDVSLYIQEIDEIETEDNRPIDQSENLKLTFRHDFIPGIFIANCY